MWLNTTRLLGKNLTNKYIYFSNNVTFRFIRLISAGKTALHRAAMSGQIDEMKKLIQRKENLNARDKSGHTALHYAAVKGNNEMVTTLIQAKCDVNVDDAIAILKMEYNDTLSTFYKDWVSEAISQGQYEVVWKFLDKVSSSRNKGKTLIQLLLFYMYIN